MNSDLSNTLRTPEEFEASFATRKRSPRVPPKPTPTPRTTDVISTFPIEVVAPPSRTSKAASPLDASPPQLASEGQSDRFRMLARDEIITLPDQPRSSANVRTNLQELVDSIASLGIQTPLQVWWNPEARHYQVYDGHRRLAALDELAMQRPELHRQIPAVILTSEQMNTLLEIPEDDRLFVLSLTINATRSDLPKADRGRAYRRLIDKFGVSGTARICGVSRQAIHKTLRAAEDADRHQEYSIAPIDRPAWTQKQWFTVAESMVKHATRLDTRQRQSTADWLRRLADSVQSGDTRVPQFETPQ